MELFDFAKLIGGHIEFSGSFSTDNTYCNVYLRRGHEEIRGWSCFGRSVKPDLDEALKDLAAGLTQRKTIKFGQATYDVPVLKHTPGYRGKRVKKKPAQRA